MRTESILNSREIYLKIQIFIEYSSNEYLIKKDKSDQKRQEKIIPKVVYMLHSVKKFYV